MLRVLNLSKIWIFSFRLVMLSIIVFSQAYAGTKYDSGKFPNVAKIGNTIIEVHKSGNFNTLWYRIGTLDKNKVTWGPSHKYGSGTNPSITVIGNTLIEAHQYHDKSTHMIDTTPLYYRIGTLSADKTMIMWGNQVIYNEDGVKPFMTVSGNKIIEMHRFPHLYNIEDIPVYDEHGEIVRYDTKYHYYYTLQYSLGILESNQFIRWIDSGIYDVAVKQATIASAGDVMVEAHQSESIESLWYRVGIIHDNGIEWGMNFIYAPGSNPSLSISGNTIVSRHNCYNSYKLCYGVGVIDKASKTIHWGFTEFAFDTGINSSIVLDGNQLVETHESEHFNSLYFNLGIINADTKTINWNAR